MKRIFFVVLMVILMAQLSVATDSCDGFCQDESFAYGECLDTTDEGFCEGDSELTVYGFDYCTDFQRCCCGSGEISDEVETEEETSLEEETEEETSSWSFDWGIDFSSDSSICTEEKSTAELIFWFLLVIVIILGLSNLIVPKKPRKEEEISLE